MVVSLPKEWAVINKYICINIKPTHSAVLSHAILPLWDWSNPDYCYCHKNEEGEK